jgi:outer membrane scaffolding protein for murein synthesis (MipA/OmpV family)
MSPHVKSLKLVIVVLLLMTVRDGIADSEVTRIPIIDAPPGTVGLGFGYRLATSPYFEDKETSDLEEEKLADLVPMYLFEGKYFFAHGTSYGIHVFRKQSFTADLLARYRFDRLDPSSSDYYDGLQERDQTVDGGISLSFNGRFGSLKFDWVTDLRDKHNGEEFDLTYRYRFDRGRWMFSPFISYIYQDKDLTNYYYGISENEALPGRPAYQTEEAFFVRAGVNSSYQLTKRWLIYANIAFEGLDDSLRESPLSVEENLASVFVGGSYMFGNIFKADEVEYDREREWSWRVNYGYTADGSIVTDILRGDLSKSDDVDDTGIAGFTISKLILGGPKIDTYARFAIFRHLEGDYQSNFWSYAPYVMLMGRGYTPWSEQPSFRWGFGLGFSYAQKVPIIEQVKQAKKGKNTSHFLNYLEWTLDFPLERITGSKAMRDCFIGITDVHRSGIFASADILGNVSGGSDWVTFHVECLR